MNITPALDAVILELYEGYLGPYWEPERRMVQNGYADVAVPFEELPVPAVDMRQHWEFDHLMGYLATWSPLKRYARDHRENLLAVMQPKLEAAWAGQAQRAVTWALKVRAFRIA